VTAVTEPAQLWSSMPGWGIFTDLTPPELTASRQLRVLRKLIISLLAVVLLLCAAGYAYAVMKHSAAKSALSQEEARTSQLQSQVSKYSAITQMQETVTQVQSQVTGVLAGDVDYTSFLTQVRAALPATMTLKNETMTIGAGTTAGSSGNVLDTSGKPLIGKLTLAGGATKFDDVSTYVDSLKAISGIVDIVPTSSTAATGDNQGVQFTMTLNVNNDVLSHRFDAGKNGGQ
jgi:Tfp pilus assembly protein PilN